MENNAITLYVRHKIYCFQEIARASRQANYLTGRLVVVGWLVYEEALHIKHHAPELFSLQIHSDSLQYCG